MSREELLVNLEYWADCLENPTYNSLEAGFRHTPLTKDEIIQRYREECNMTRAAILRVIEIIEKDGIE
jgi:pyrrolidone-carboxylate peptidase